MEDERSEQKAKLTEVMNYKSYAQIKNKAKEKFWSITTWKQAIITETVIKSKRNIHILVRSWWYDLE